MSKTTTKAGDANGVRSDDLEAEVDEVVAAWDRAELENKRARARRVVESRRFEQGRTSGVGDIPFWEQRLARKGCRPVLAAWPTVPVPSTAATPFLPNNTGSVSGPRPVVYDAGSYRLDETGIYLRRSGYKISSPVFQVARGIDDTRPDAYAVLAGGKWNTATVDPRHAVRQPGALVSALVSAGLRLNPEPVRLDGNHEPASMVGRQAGDLDHFVFTAGDRLAVFLADHARELPLRS